MLSGGVSTDYRCECVKKGKRLGNTVSLPKIHICSLWVSQPWTMGGSLADFRCQGEFVDFRSPTPFSQTCFFESEVYFFFSLKNVEFKVIHCRCYDAWDPGTWFRLTPQVLEQLNSTIPTLWNTHVTNVNLERLGLGLDNPARTVFQSFWSNKRFSRGNDHRLQMRMCVKKGHSWCREIFLMGKGLHH